MTDLLNQVALVTGASRGIGASTAQQLALRGADVVVNYRSKGPRAEQVAQSVRSAGRRALLVQADITDDADLRFMTAEVRREFGRLDVLIMNASGGLEKDRAEDYAMQLNLHAQVSLLTACLPLLSTGGRVVFVTSHWAHFYGSQPVFPAYEAVAASKYAGEQALRARIEELQARKISLVVVSGDLIEGTITPKLLERKQAGVIEGRRQQAGALPTVEEFASAIVDAAAERGRPSGHTTYVGSTDELNA
ncbi:SDR family oxidoreductase (plasmid) [Deinococcus sp. KNUC1210]|uniref:SDR family oxidoreductase n=1 Tax=Deinococcus sp. KNUC1210 TaxID=2917691 RepID=UPI001EF12B17|nr:SDR family oxidoreductase [Deinococcus sp. KNUC1210]ULH17173.1 SDR family oxidoreductase [Deinococcus sp. KNUC1210]